MEIPKTYGQLLQFAQSATILSWHRDPQTLDLYHDDFTADRRTVVTARFKIGKAGTFEVRTLCSYNKAKNMWGEYCQPQGNIEVQNRQGQKALLAWLREKAIEQCDFIPNPAQLHIYKS